MAKVANPLNSTEARGKLGGIEYRQLRAGSVVGRRSIASPNRSTRSSNVAGWLKAAHTAWDSLSQRNKDRWTALSGDSRSGRSYYVTNYIRCKLVETTPPTTPDIHRAHDPVWDISVTSWDAANLRANIVWSTTSTGYIQVIVRVLPSFRRLVNPPLSKYQFSRGFNLTVAGGYIYFRHLAPYAWVDVLMFEKGDGEILCRRTFEAFPTWNAGPGESMIWTPGDDTLMSGYIPPDPDSTPPDAFAF